MKFYYDTEFIEGQQSVRLFDIELWKTKPTIDLISIGVVSEGGHSFYRVCKDFNLKEAWLRYDWKTSPGIEEQVKEYWLRKNVLRPIFDELIILYRNRLSMLTRPDMVSDYSDIAIVSEFNYDNLKYLLGLFGSTKETIAKDLLSFMQGCCASKGMPQRYDMVGYYADYDHVVLCWLYGKMIDLPQNMSWYTYDLKQLMDEHISTISKKHGGTYEAVLENFMVNPNYPKPEREHHSLYNARFTRNLHEFLVKYFPA